MRVDDVQFPSSELLPAAVGSVDELRCSNPAHPAATLAAMQIAAINSRFFMSYPGKADQKANPTHSSYRADEAHRTVWGEREVYHPVFADSGLFLRMSSAGGGKSGVRMPDSGIHLTG
jgi:hypothetical protein